MTALLVVICHSTSESFKIRSVFAFLPSFHLSTHCTFLTYAHDSLMLFLVSSTKFVLPEIFEFFPFAIYLFYHICVPLRLLSNQQRKDVKSLQKQYTGANELLMVTQSDYLIDFTIGKFTLL